ncbi:NAD(P)-dependent oxidoreductase [Paraburkholderia nemoris]|uniref:NAD(P)-dependent oxidoreductase n=1 Tax=Paraburkholderia nemoris TaxID=2793076 RepID=UPI0038BC4E13
MRTIFVDCTPELYEAISRRRLPVPAGLEFHVGNPDGEEMLELCRGADVVLVEHSFVPDALFRENTGLREIVFMGTGASSYINLTAAESADVPVSTVSRYGDRAVAEHTVALMFAGARQIARMDRDVRGGIWMPLSGQQLHERKLAVLGLGGVGTAVAELGQALGMDVYGWSATSRSAPFFEPDLRKALQSADVVSVHLALTKETQGLLTEELLHLPSRGFLLVNTARAALVDRKAMIAALDSGQMGHASLDVFDAEPLPRDDTLARRSNTTLTSHAAYMTEEAYCSLWRKALDHLRRIAAAD